MARKKKKNISHNAEKSKKDLGFLRWVFIGAGCVLVLVAAFLFIRSKAATTPSVPSGEEYLLVKETLTDEIGESDFIYDYLYDSKGYCTEMDVSYIDGTFDSAERYTYNTDGRKIRTETLNANRSLENYSETEYDAQGLPIKENSYMHDGTIITVKECEYKDGAELRHTFFDKDGNVFSYTANSYDKDGNLAEETSYDGSGNVSLRTVYEYDGSGNALTVTDLQPDGTQISKAENTYDANGRIIEQYVDNGDMPDIRTVYEYDENGNNTKVLTYRYVKGEEQFQSTTVREYIPNPAKTVDE